MLTTIATHAFANDTNYCDPLAISAPDGKIIRIGSRDFRTCENGEPGVATVRGMNVAAILGPDNRLSSPGVGLTLRTQTLQDRFAAIAKYNDPPNTVHVWSGITYTGWEWGPTTRATSGTGVAMEVYSPGPYHTSVLGAPPVTPRALVCNGAGGRNFWSGNFCSVYVGDGDITLEVSMTTQAILSSTEPIPNLPAFVQDAVTSLRAAEVTDARRPALADLPRIK